MHLEGRGVAEMFNFFQRAFRYAMISFMHSDFLPKCSRVPQMGDY